MNLPQTLTKENFFNQMMEKYPKATKGFCDWIDEYKKAVKWNELFQVDSPRNPKQAMTYPTPPKFHDIPYAMQLGIWFEFCSQNLHKYFEQAEHPAEMFDLMEDIKEVFSEIEDLVEEDDCK